MASFSYVVALLVSEVLLIMYARYMNIVFLLTIFWLQCRLGGCPLTSCTDL